MSEVVFLNNTKSKERGHHISCKTLITKTIQSTMGLIYYVYILEAGLFNYI